MIDFTTPIRTFRGEPIEIEAERLTLAEASLRALQHLFPDEQLSEKQKLDRYRLGVKIAQAEEPLKLTAEEIATLKAVISKYWNAVVMGRCYELLDPVALAPA